MAVQTSYPGVYVQEVPSGVRTIAGVSTSVTAFVGTAKRGPINKSYTITSFSDYERKFGGLSNDSEMSFAVRQFFLNGGTTAIIVRLAANPAAAARDLMNSGAGAINVLHVEAADQGKEGNQIQVAINYKTANPDSLFNLVVSYSAGDDNPSDNIVETFTNLSMNSAHARYVETIVNDSSELVHVTRLVPPATLAALAAAMTVSGQLANVATLLDDAHTRFRIMINGSDALNVELNPLTDVALPVPIDTLCAAIEAQVSAQGPNPGPIGAFTCVANAAKDRIVMTSGEGGENSRIEILPGLGKDISVNLKLGITAGGQEIDAVSTVRPAEAPLHSTLTSGDLVDADITGTPTPANNLHLFRISMDGSAPLQVDLGTVAAAGATHPLRMQDVANKIQTAVRALRPASDSFNLFTCTVIDGTTVGTDYRFVFTPGSRGANSAVSVSQEPGDNLAINLKLLVNATPDTATVFQAIDVLLQGGNEQPVTDLNRYAVFVGNQALRTGIYALEEVDIFNILCLPAITGTINSGILMESDAYCKSRRAFMIVDSPPDADKPNEMATAVSGTTLPKSDYAAVYYPWIQISNPLNDGALRQTAPCGTIAGLYARIDGSRGVWKAPAGIEANLNGVQKLQYILTDRENGILNPLGVNCLRIFPDAGAVSWGSRTLNGADSIASEWKYIPVRRTALFIEESLYRGLKWVVFEPNDEPLWAQIRLNVGAFMQGLFRQGAFQGVKKDDAYFVKCDKETTTQNDINLGRVNIWVGFAPLKPAEFVILYLQQMAGQIQV